MVVQAINSADYVQNKSFIETVSIFHVLTKTQKELLISSVSSLKFKNEENIVVEGDPGDLFYLIKEGSVVCRRQGSFLRNMSVGEYFGEQALLYGTPRTATVTAIGDVKCLVINRNDLALALGNQLSQIIYRNSIKIAFEKSRILNTLSSGQKEAIINKMKITT